MLMEHFVRRTGAIFGTLRAEYRQIINRYFGHVERFNGSAREICAQIVDRLWEDDFYRTSLGHFNFFWMRDFGTVADSLTRIGQKDHVQHTLKWALKHYRRAGAVTLCIDKAGNTFNAPARKSVDALPWLLHSIVVSDYELSGVERAFLERQLRRYRRTFLDRKTGLLKTMHYAELRDAVYYDRSAYALSLVARMARCAKELELEGLQFGAEIYHDELLANYWTGSFFKADFQTDVYSSECALMPFFLGVITEPDLANKTFDYINKAKLNDPYPLIYCPSPIETFDYRFGMGPYIMPNYTGSTIWTWHATFYLHSLKKFDRPEYDKQYAKFSELIEKTGTYPELINTDLSWFKAPIYKADPGMVWAALFLSLPEPKLAG
jgi:hypothetical protein